MRSSDPPCFCFARCRARRLGQPAPAAIIPKARGRSEHGTAMKKAPRNKPWRPFVSYAWPSRPSVGLLDRRDFPIAAARTQEGPDLGDLDRLLRALDDLAARTVERLVDQRKPHRDAGEICLAFAPGFREVALQQLGCRHLVDAVASAVVVEVTLEIRHHFRRRQAAQPSDILVRPRRLDLAEQPLERFVVGGLHLEWRAGAARAEPEAHAAAGRLRRTGIEAGGTGIGRLRPLAALPP